MSIFVGCKAPRPCAISVKLVSNFSLPFPSRLAGEQRSPCAVRTTNGERCSPAKHDKRSREQGTSLVRGSAALAGVALMVITSMLSVSAAAGPDEGLVGRWQFTKDRVSGREVKPLAGELAGKIFGPVTFSPQAPHAMVFDGNSKAKHRIVVTDALAAAKLPRQDITVEAWVRVDRPGKWSGIIGVLQDNGNYEKGWFLGVGPGGANFCFGIASVKVGRLTYLPAAQPFAPGAWYHVAGTYDGTDQRLYVDGKLAATARRQTGPIAYPPKGFYTIGAYHDDNELYALSGQIEQVSVYERAMGPAEIARRFAARKKAFPDIEPAAAETVADWPTYMHDNSRSGRTEAPLPEKLVLQWTYHARRGPSAAWPPPAKHDLFHKKTDLKPRVIFDRAFHVVTVGDGVYFGSSSEDTVCRLDAATGTLDWTFHTEGPVRLAPSVADGKVYFGCDDGFVYCLRAETGQLVWKTHAAPQSLRIPGNGRIISLWPVRTGVVVASGQVHLTAGLFPIQGVYQCRLDAGTGKVLERTKIKRSAQGYPERRGSRLFSPTGRHRKGTWPGSLARRGKAAPARRAGAVPGYPAAAIAAGPNRIAGGDGKVAVFGPVGLTPLWSAKVAGQAHSLAVSRGRLFVSTDRGTVTCFAAGRGSDGVVRPPKPAAMPASPGAAKILAHTKVRKGYCLVLGGDVALAAGLATGSEFQVVCVQRDAAAAAAARRRLGAAGLAGRVTVHHCTEAKLPYGDYLFNLVVDADLLAGRPAAAPRAEMIRVLRPCGGTAVLGPQPEAIFTRGPLKGQGEWTHLYGDPGNTACSSDALTGAGATTVQWFGRPGPETMVDRHNRGAAPLYKDGRVFTTGLDHIAAVDAYNGTVLWAKDLSDSVRAAAGKNCGNMAAASDGLYVAAGATCHMFDPQTGSQIRALAVPGEGDWGYVACTGDLLLGTRTRKGASRWAFTSRSWMIGYSPSHPLVCSDRVFAHDRRTGRRLWTYSPKVGVIINPTLTAADGRLYFVESGNPKSAEVASGRVPLGVLLTPSADLVALDVRTGQVVWRKTIRPQLQHFMFLSASRGVLLLTGSKSIVVAKRKRTRYDMHAFEAKTGRELWTVSHTPVGDAVAAGGHGELSHHPAIVGEVIYIVQSAYALKTGKPIATWKWTRGGHGCGTISTSLLGVFNRGGSPQQTNLKTGLQSPLTRVTRPGCWINILPAGGLVLIPEGSSGCTCDFAVQTSMALRPVPGKPAPAKP